MATKVTPSPDLVLRLASNYKLPLVLVRSRWRVAKERATSDGHTDYQTALQIFHSLRNAPLPKSTSPLPLSRRRRNVREATERLYNNRKKDI